MKRFEAQELERVHKVNQGGPHSFRTSFCFKSYVENDFYRMKACLLAALRLSRQRFPR